MKKILGISLVAALAVSPLAANAAGGTFDNTTTHRLTEASNESSAVATGTYVQGAYNELVGNVNSALTYEENGTVATIKAATVSADDVALTVTGFTPAGSVAVDTSASVVTGTVSVPTTVDVVSTWGSTNTTTASLGGATSANLTNGTVTADTVTASFTGTASGDLSGTGSFSNASVDVDGWHQPAAPSETPGA